jgi:type IV secretion system protein VirB6
LQKPLAAAGVLSIVLMGYGMIQGLIKMPMRALSGWIIRMGFIFFFAMNWGNFSFYAVGLFDKGMGELSQAVMNATHTPVAGKSMASGLQTAFTNILHVGLWTMKKASLKHWTPAFSAFFIWISGLIVIGVALCEIIVAKIMLSVCLTTAPLFIVLVLFEQTKSFFDRWLGSIVGFSLVLFFVSVVVSLSLSLIHATISGYLPTQASDMETVGWVPIVLVACLCATLLIQAAHVAKHIGGACHTASGTATAAGVGASAASVFMIMNTKLKGLNNFRKGGASSGSTNKALGSISQGLQNASHYTSRGEL